MMNQREWFSSVLNRRVTTTEIATHLGVSRKTGTTKVSEGLSAGEIITVARALGVNPVVALQELGMLTIDEVYEFLESDGTLVATASDEELVAELAERVIPARRLASLSKRAADRIDAAANFSQRRNQNVGDDDYNSVTDLPMVADSSPDEDELRGRNDDDVP